MTPEMSDFSPAIGSLCADVVNTNTPRSNDSVSVLAIQHGANIGQGDFSIAECGMRNAECEDLRSSVVRNETGTSGPDGLDESRREADLNLQERAAPFDFNADGKVPAESAGRAPRPDLRPQAHVLPHETPSALGFDTGLRVAPAPSAALLECRATEAEVRDAKERDAVCRQYETLRADGLSLGQAAGAMGKSGAWFSGPESPYGKWKSGVSGRKCKVQSPTSKVGDLTAAIEGLGWFVRAARYFNLNINRTMDSGSVPEAVRRTISLPAVPVGWTHGYTARLLRYIRLGEVPSCPVEIREAILAREREGMPLVPERIARQIVINRNLVRYVRNGTDAMLRTMNASGCSRFALVNGEYEPLRCGQRMQPDDGSINFCVTVPWKFPTDTVSRRYGVLVGRFQLLLFVDAMSLNIAARSFVVRPRSSYRQEDALHLYNVFMRQHGVPDEIWHEGHVWNSGRVKDCLDLLKVRRHLVHSPHNKAAVEGRFNKLWTVLSGLTGGQIGRFRGEMERENELLMSCRSGATDPRRVFPSISIALEAIDQAIREANATTVRTDVGAWRPDELWAEQLGQSPLRPYEAETEWMFSPYCLERQINNGFNAKLPLFEDFSVPFCFASEWMAKYHGARARCYFDPYGDRFGTVVLAEGWYGEKAGSVLGIAKQTNDIGEYARLMLGVGFGPDDSGRVIRQRQAAAMRSDRRAIAGSDKGLHVITERDGISTTTEFEKSEGRRPKAEGSPKSEVRSPNAEDLAEREREAAEFERRHAGEFL